MNSTDFGGSKDNLRLKSNAKLIAQARRKKVMPPMLKVESIL